MFSCLFGHISLTINWEPLTVIFLTAANRKQVNQIFNKITNEDQYTIKVVFAGVFVKQLLGPSEKLSSLYSPSL